MHIIPARPWCYDYQVIPFPYRIHFEICRCCAYASRLSKEIETGAKRNTDLIKQGFREAEPIAKEMMCEEQLLRKRAGKKSEDLGLPDAEEHLVKVRLVLKIDSIMKERAFRFVNQQ
jgi:hypothetical protein